MSVLPDKTIREKIVSEHEPLEVEPVDLEEQLQPCSLDIRLGHEFSKYRPRGNSAVVLPDDDVDERMVSWNSEKVKVSPDDFILANTIEHFSFPDDMGAEIRGRSSLGRLGVEIHSCAGWVDAGFEGELVLEISNDSDCSVELRSGMRVAQVVFYELTEEAKEPYGEKDNKYQNQRGAVSSRIHYGG